MKILRSSLATHDLVDIACYISNDNPLAAERRLDSVDKLLHLIVRNPEMGQSVEHLKSGLRRYVHGRYLLFYLPQSSGILLYRVLHGARRIEELLE